MARDCLDRERFVYRERFVSKFSASQGSADIVADSDLLAWHEGIVPFTKVYVGPYVRGKKIWLPTSVGGIWDCVIIPRPF